MSLLLFCQDPTFRIWSDAASYPKMIVVEMRLTQLQRRILKEEMKYSDKRIAWIDANPKAYGGMLGVVDSEELKERVRKHEGNKAHSPRYWTCDKRRILVDMGFPPVEVSRFILGLSFMDKWQQMDFDQRLKTRKENRKYLQTLGDAKTLRAGVAVPTSTPVTVPVYSHTPVVEKRKSAPQPSTVETIGLAKDFAECISESERQRFGILAALLK